MSATIRVPYVDYPDDGLFDFEPTRTHQSFKDECDFNNVLKKWSNSGLITHVNTVQPKYFDCTGVSDYQSSLELIRAAQNQFFSLPAVLRDRFGNDPARLLTFLADPANRDEAIKLGLVVGAPVGSSKEQTTGEPTQPEAA